MSDTKETDISPEIAALQSGAGINFNNEQQAAYSRLAHLVALERHLLGTAADIAAVSELLRECVRVLPAEAIVEYLDVLAERQPELCARLAIVTLGIRWVH